MTKRNQVIAETNIEVYNAMDYQLQSGHKLPALKIDEDGGTHTYLFSKDEFLYREEQNEFFYRIDTEFNDECEEDWHCPEYIKIHKAEDKVDVVRAMISEVEMSADDDEYIGIVKGILNGDIVEYADLDVTYYVAIF